MATNTLLQSLNDSANQATIDSSNRRQVETYLASAAIAAGDAVCFDASKTNASDKALYVLKASTNAATSKCFVGIAIEAAAAAGDRIKVCISGICIANITAANAASAGVNLMISSHPAAGELADYSAGSVLQNVGISCEARDGDGQATVMIFKQF